MIDFSKKMQERKIEKKINPIEIYDELDRTSVAGPLRPAQMDILQEWYEKCFNQRDTIVKLHTGEGKSLIGLLMLQSKINSGEGPCVYVCPNKLLMDQLYSEANKFGIPVCTIGGNNIFPSEFSAGKMILLTHAHKLFNGKTIFGIKGSHENVNAIVIDDAHACIDSIREAYTISISRRDNKDIFDRFLNLFENDLREQGEGTYWDIKENNDYESIMRVPYWAWLDKKDEVMKIIMENREEDFLKFVWPLVKDSLDICEVYISVTQIQITPSVTQIEMFGSFYHAKNRIMMSATTQDDIFFVKSMGIDINAIKNPLMIKGKKWSGEKMILLPSLIDEKFTRDYIIEYFMNRKYKFGVVALVPNWKLQDNYKEYNTVLAVSDSILGIVSSLQSGVYEKNAVLVNRYDGIDLPDASCRILIIDSLPFAINLKDRYEEACREDCRLIQKKIAQKIEQGFGRSVRGEKDYSCIMVIGADIVKFLRNETTKKMFSEQTIKQVEIGLNLVEWAKEGRAEVDIKDLVGLINQCLKRDEGWKEFYKQEMNSITLSEKDDSEFRILEHEKRAEEFLLKQRYQEAVQEIQDIIDENNLDGSEKGWYLQLIAEYIYKQSKMESNKYQKAAFEKNMFLLKPKEGITYTKLNNYDLNRLNNIKQFLEKYANYEQLMIDINSILDNMSFGIEADKFENAIDKIGQLLGFVTQRPDKMIRKGPDNLWGIDDNSYVMIECKSEVLETRECIKKTEASQMSSHCGWFESEYGRAKVERIMIIPTINMAYDAYFSHEVKIIRKSGLRKFKTNIMSFVKEFKNYDLSSLNLEFIQRCLEQHDLESKDGIMSPYEESWKRKE